jgi:hypothetical protein
MCLGGRAAAIAVERRELQLVGRTDFSKKEVQDRPVVATAKRHVGEKGSKRSKLLTEPAVAVETSALCEWKGGNAEVGKIRTRLRSTKTQEVLRWQRSVL